MGLCCKLFQGLSCCILERPLDKKHIHIRHHILPAHTCSPCTACEVDMEGKSPGAWIQQQNHQSLQNHQSIHMGPKLCKLFEDDDNYKQNMVCLVKQTIELVKLSSPMLLPAASCSCVKNLPCSTHHASPKPFPSLSNKLYAMLTLHTNTVNTNFSALFTEFAIVIEAVEALIVGELGWIFTATDSKVYD